MGVPEDIMGRSGGTCKWGEQGSSLQDTPFLVGPWGDVAVLPALKQEQAARNSSAGMETVITCGGAWMAGLRASHRYGTRGQACGRHSVDHLEPRSLAALLSVPLPFCRRWGSYRCSVSQQDTGDPLPASPTSQVLARYSYRQEVSKHTLGIAEDGSVAIVTDLHDPERHWCSYCTYNKTHSEANLLKVSNQSMAE